MKKIFILVLALAIPAYGADTLTISDTSIFKDSWLSGNASCNGEATTLYAHGTNWRIILGNDTYVDSIPAGNTIVSAICSTYFTSAPPDTYAVAILLLKDCWPEHDTGSGEGGVTTYDWASPDSEWAKTHADSADDTGSFNCLDGDGPDRQETPMDSVLMDGEGWYSFDITEGIKSCYANSRGFGMLLLTRSDGNTAIRSGEYSDGSLGPRITIIHESAAAATGNRRRRESQRMLLEQ